MLDGTLCLCVYTLFFTSCADTSKLIGQRWKSGTLWSVRSRRGYCWRGSSAKKRTRGKMWVIMWWSCDLCTSSPSWLQPTDFNYFSFRIYLEMLCLVKMCSPQLKIQCGFLSLSLSLSLSPYAQTHTHVSLKRCFCLSSIPILVYFADGTKAKVNLSPGDTTSDLLENDEVKENLSSSASYLWMVDHRGNGG